MYPDTNFLIEGFNQLYEIIVQLKRIVADPINALWLIPGHVIPVLTPNLMLRHFISDLCFSRFLHGHLIPLMRPFPYRSLQSLLNNAA